MTSNLSKIPKFRWQEAVIEEISPLSAYLKSFFFRLPEVPADQLAGQHVDLKLTAPDGYTAERSYSIASAPGAPLIELAVERIDDGEVSAFFHDIAEVGDTIELRGPLGGHFVWRASDGGPLLLAGGGSGIAPLIAMLRHRKNTGSSVPALLLYSVRTLADLAYGKELLQMEADDPDLKVVLAITREAPARVGDYARRFDDESVGEVLKDWGHRPAHAYVCGSNPFVNALATALTVDGVPAEIIRTERFGGSE